MTRTEFGNLVFFWGWWTFFEAVWIAVLWQSRSRVLSGGIYRIPGARRIGRGDCVRRVEALLAELERRGVPAEGGPDKDELVDRWHRVVAGRFVSVLLQAVPLLAVALPFWWTTSLARTTTTPLWMFAAIAGFGAVSLALMAADERATAVSDPSGVVTVKAIRFLDMLLIPSGRRPQDSALDVHGKLFRRLGNALRTQARHGTRTMPPATRARVREDTERLIAALADADQRYLLGEGADREAAVRDLSRLVAGVLRHSCRPRAQRDSLVVVDAVLLPDTPEPDAADVPAEPLRSRLLAGAGRLAVAVGLLAGAVLLPGGGAASDLLAAAGLATVALICPPLREALHRAKELLVGGAPTGDRGPETPDDESSAPTAAPTGSCPHCASHSSVTAGSRRVGS
ncbi:hypothetical protein ACFS5L_32055 [Streptomyces phyllanthi]|uniref:Uncharacterized protein n=1 Tax=Streptomyces phyllanthi TaxID=1803180 RepID=A0A5N8WDJ6_9ACTN|nr:hypothetical protein [Streptomyces phyllanthi]MPY45212.1 hypothetical protein [Streptomyces phyllanthi]